MGRKKAEATPIPTEAAPVAEPTTAIATVHPFARWLDEAMVKALTAPTPPGAIYKREGRGKTMLDYVSIGYVTHKLNEVFGLGWSFSCRETSDMAMIAKTGQIVVKGILSIDIPGDAHMLGGLTREQYGSADVKFYGVDHPKAGRPIDIGDDFKSAASDALKKCASSLGVASDIYYRDWEKFEKMTEAVASDATTEPAAEAVKNIPTGPVAVSQELTAARAKLFNAYKDTYKGEKDAMSTALKSSTGKDSFMNLTMDDITKATEWVGAGAVQTC